MLMLSLKIFGFKGGYLFDSARGETTNWERVHYELTSIDWLPNTVVTKKLQVVSYTVMCLSWYEDLGLESSSGYYVP